MSSLISCEMLDRNDWMINYQRNNKQSGLKNLRCFPACSQHGHSVQGFCGRPVKLKVQNPQNKTLLCYATFVCLGQNNNSTDDAATLEALVEGDVVKESEITAKVRSKLNPFLPWFEGELGNNSNVDITRARTEQNMEFIINKGRKGWHYGWYSTKYTCSNQHVLRVFVFEPVSENRLKVVARCDSPAFTLFCRRRQKSLSSDEVSTKVVEQQSPPKKELTEKRKSCETKKMLKRKSSSLLVAPEVLPEGTLIPEATVAQKETLMFHVLRTLLRISNSASSGSSSPVTAKSSPRYSDLRRMASSKTDFEPVGPIPEMSLDHQNFAELFDLDFSVLSKLENDLASVPSQQDSQTPSVTTCHVVPRKDLKFRQIVQELGHFMIEETEFTEQLERAMTELALSGTNDPALFRKYGGRIMLNMLETFLTQYQLTSSELFYLFETQIWSKKVKRLEQKIPKTGKRMSKKKSEEKQILLDCEQLAAENKAAEDAATASFVAALLHYRDCIVESRPKGMLEFNTHMDAVYPLANTVYIPPENDFNGLYKRHTETLDILENIRESMGVPWVIRKCVRHVESNLSLRHLDGAIEVRTNRKLLTNGYTRYILDGEPHEWHSPNPITTEGLPAEPMTYVATLQDGVLSITHNYSKKKRVKRESRKESESTIRSTIYFQYRNSLKQQWQDRLVTSCLAFRVDTSEPNIENPSPVCGGDCIDYRFAQQDLSSSFIDASSWMSDDILTNEMMIEF